MSIAGRGWQLQSFDTAAACILCVAACDMMCSIIELKILWQMQAQANVTANACNSCTKPGIKAVLLHV